MNFFELKHLIRKSIPKRIKNFVSYSEDIEYGTVSFSQFGEDIVLNQLLKGKANGFYVDVGAHDPFRFSNTYFFYKRGWRGINIDPMPGIKNRFDKHRPLDVNLECGVGDEEGNLSYFFANHPAMNTFIFQKEASFKGKTQIPVFRLESILDKYMPPNTQLDFLSIDTEGYDLKVLKSNNWEKYRPSFVVVEDKELFMKGCAESDVYNYLKLLKYTLAACTGISYIYTNEPTSPL